VRLLPLLVMAVAVPAQDVVPLRLVPTVREGRPALALAVDPGVHVSARAVPVLELADGGRVPIGRGRVSADSAWFTEAAWAPRPSGARVRGILRVAYCRPAERFCRTAAVPVDLPGEPVAASGRR
jgi:hypothetical protein